MNWAAVFIFIWTSTISLFDKTCAEQSFSKCPIGKQFDIEAQLTCPENKDHFHCVPVLPDNNDVISICKRPKWFVKGTFPVWSPKYKKITSVPCASGRYQEYSYKSNNVSVFKCSKEKSFCNGKGQVTLFRNNSTENNLCFCMDGYTYLKEPKIGKYCNQHVENCSCIWMRKDQKSEVMTKSILPNKETEKDSVIRTDEGIKSTYNLESKPKSTYMILLAVLLCIAILYYADHKRKPKLI